MKLSQVIMELLVVWLLLGAMTSLLVIAGLGCCGDLASSYEAYADVVPRAGDCLIAVGPSFDLDFWLHVTAAPALVLKAFGH